MFVSNNIPRRKARRFSTLSGIPLTSDLGKYLSIPLLHSRATKYHFNKVIEKVQRRLTTWKSNNLNLTAGVKLNTNGCLYESTTKAGFGSLFRDHRGIWILGYYGKLGTSSVLETEIWGIYRGLTIMLEKGLSNVSIETDSQMAVKLITEGPPAGHPQQALIEDSRVLMTRTQSTLGHNFRQANQSADNLAHLGAKQESDLVVTEETPPSVRLFVLEDAMGIGHLRN
ncbi:hypothetical protein RHMOL_Rhmol07G0074100 [Rhododendron molle]|uniref:Uncharacterized protein n=1 Tax=Rhododendron molle TaxID=49168 RepID=A0ACC0MZI0_RHOML|nr:hypothetical protein RHMOL_Rhmol07G0074100 [Rhododendron molle]